MDELKVSHVDSFEDSNFAGHLSSIYGGLSVNRGEIHDYLVIDLNYCKQGTVKVSMIKYLDSVLQEFPEQLGTITATPAADHLFMVWDEEKNSN